MNDFVKVQVHLTAVLEAHSMAHGRGTLIRTASERGGGSGAAKLGDVSRVGLGANSGSIALSRGWDQRARKVYLNSHSEGGEAAKVLND